VQHETDLIGDGGTTGRSIGGQLGLVQLDQVLGLTARAIEAVVDPFWRAMINIGDDEADIGPELRRLDSGDGASLPVLGVGLVARLGVTAHDSVRSVRIASAFSSTFFDKGLVPERPKT